jgi:uncharacterized protein YciI
MNKLRIVLLAVIAASMEAAVAQDSKPVVPDPVLAKQLGADERGMRKYVLAILKTGPHRTPDGPARDELFKGHFANIARLADEGKLVVAGPFGDKTDWRGMFILAVETPEAAQQLVATDPVIRSGEMIAEYHVLYSSAALMEINEIHKRISPK